MTLIFRNVLSSEDLDYLNHLPEVLEAKNSSTGHFSIELTDSIRTALARLGLNHSNVSRIPMRWMKDDTVEHVDTGSNEFTKTILVYLTSSTGQFIVGDTSYLISANTGFVFNEGTPHRTVGTELRLLMGPMSELADPVGLPFTPQNKDIRMNYGVWANGLLVESCSLNFMKKWSNMTLYS